MWIRRRRFRPILLILLSGAIITQIVALSPSSLEEIRPTKNTPLDPSALIQDDEPTLIPGIPKDRVPEYGIYKFKYVSVQNSEKQWRIESEKAFLYNPERMVHSRGVTAYLYDPDGKITVVTGQEAKYFMNKKDLEMYGNVRTLFPDGFLIESEYLRYKPGEKRIIIPREYWSKGSGVEDGGQIFHFLSRGLDYLMGDAVINLTEDVTVTLDRAPARAALAGSPLPSSTPTPSPTPPASPSPSQDENVGVPDRTTIQSDHCLIKRAEQLAFFTMNASRNTNSRFVHITQPTLFTRARRAELNYGNFSKVLQYLTAYEDVLIKETESSKPKPSPSPSLTKSPFPTPTSKPSLRYATGGRADFDTRRDVVVITEYPQVYQNEDTVTGDTILLHRDTDIVEVEHSNAFSQGSE